MRSKVLEIKRYEGLDILKTICAFLIICIHAPFPGIIGEYIISLARVVLEYHIFLLGYL